MNGKNSKEITISVVCAFLLFSCLAVVFYVHKSRPFIKHQGVIAKIFGRAGQGRIALIIDDWGYHDGACSFLDDLDIPVAVSVLPKLTYSRFSAECARHYSKDVMLHLPLEPDHYSETYPDRYVISRSMSDQLIASVIADFLENVPYAQGANNHMGSKATRDPALMAMIFRELKARKLFFVDSYSSAHSVCEEVARRTKISFGKRDIFLDNVSSREYIENQFKKLADLSKKQGYAIGIAHARELTLTVIKEQSQILREQGFVFVSVNDLLKRN